MMATRVMVSAGMLAEPDETPRRKRQLRGLLWGERLLPLEELEEAPKRKHPQRRWLQSRLLLELRSLTSQRCEHVDVRVHLGG
jgi:hypothetical protein